MNPAESAETAAMSLERAVFEPHLMGIPVELRLEILRNALIFDRNRVDTYSSAQLEQQDLLALARDPFELRERFHPGPCARTQNNFFRQDGLQRRTEYQPSAQVLRVCKQLRAEGEEVLYKENFFIGIHNSVFTVAPFQPLGFLPGLRCWRPNQTQRPMPEPLVRLNLRYPGLNVADGWFLLPACALHDLALSLHRRTIFMAGAAGVDFRLHITFVQNRNLLRMFHVGDSIELKTLLQSELVDWIGTEVRGNLRTGFWTPNAQDRATGLVSPIQNMELEPAQQKRYVDQAKEDFKQAYNKQRLGDLKSAMNEYLRIRENLWAVARDCPELYHVTSQANLETKFRQMLSIFSWIVFHIARSQTLQPPEWRLLFAHRALTLPALVDESEWKVRCHILAAGILETQQGLSRLRNLHLIRAFSELQPAADSAVTQQMFRFKKMVFTRQQDRNELQEVMISTRKELQKELETRYGVEMEARTDF
jgi:hypothetical protein